ncbi:MAG: HDOD domain-containing protein [Lachnospiraceae bacterium]|nr:HDOD domain-containing protein [Lachnospiraceae bacterium]
MIATLIPIFDDEMAVFGYSIFTQRDNFLLNPNLLGSGMLDGAGQIPGLDVVNSMGIDSLSEDKYIFVEVTNFSLFTDIKSLCDADPSRLILLFDTSVQQSMEYLNRLKELKSMGYGLAMRKLTPSNFGHYSEVLRLVDYALLDHTKINISSAKMFFERMFPQVTLCAVNVDTQEDYDKLREVGGYHLYEGMFFRLPQVSGERETAPLKANYIQLLNVVNDADFDLTDAADVISRDTALVIELLKMVNHMTVNSEITSVRHAAAMLGQRELKRWINTAITRKLCADKPSEITRLSLLRARFAENLADIFGLGGLSSELFLMGLFSVLDIILDKPMEEALKTVKVSRSIENALLRDTGDLAEVLDFMLEYENANWNEVDRQMVMKDIAMDQVYDAYLESLRWYRELLSA